jgi:hypothetical protein
VCGVAIEVVHKGELVCVAECVTLETFREAVECSSKHHGAIADLIFSARQTECMYFDRTFSETFFIGEIAVIGKVDVLERADDEADVLWEDERLAGEAGGLA